MKIFIRQKFKRTNLLIEPSLSYERLSHNFKFIERTRDVDFYRNWNLNKLIKLLDASKKSKNEFTLRGIINEISYKKLPKDDPKRRNPDINRAKNILDWRDISPKNVEIGVAREIK